MNFSVEYTESSKSDLKALDKSLLITVIKAIEKVSENPLPKSEGGYGNPLGKKRGINLAGLFKIKLLKVGIRIVYQLHRTDKIMKIIVIATRADASRNGG